MVKAHSIKNYTGFPNVTGNELANDMKKHLESLVRSGGEFVAP